MDLFGSILEKFDAFPLAQADYSVLIYLIKDCL